ncbi:MAG: hypothetical protein KJ793_05515 [Candidatus Omnitrophica bacterium]|nr:hypothetical protein [Candidatus Omnitrophota bacterium]
MEPEKKQQETEGQKETKTQEAKPQPEAKAEENKTKTEAKIEETKVQETKPEAEAKPKETKAKKEALAPVEKQTNCLNCNKQIKRVRRYYRDGKYYCNKRCWNDFLKKSKEPEQKS